MRCTATAGPRASARVASAACSTACSRARDIAGPCSTSPAGADALSLPLARHTDLLLEADIGLGQVRYAREHGRVPTQQIWMTASGFEIPLRDAAVDGTVCVRLNHHLPAAAERDRLVRELLRVSRRLRNHDILRFRLARRIASAGCAASRRSSRCASTNWLPLRSPACDAREVPGPVRRRLRPSLCADGQEAACLMPGSPTHLESLRVVRRPSVPGQDLVVELHPAAGVVLKKDAGTIIWREALADGTQAVIKLYRRGLAGTWRGHLGSFRVANEFEALRALESLGERCVRPLFWGHGRLGGHGRGELLATEWMPDCRPLDAILAADPEARRTTRPRAALGDCRPTARCGHLSRFVPRAKHPGATRRSCAGVRPARPAALAPFSAWHPWHPYGALRPAVHGTYAAALARDARLAAVACGVRNERRSAGTIRGQPERLSQFRSPAAGHRRRVQPSRVACQGPTRDAPRRPILTAPPSEASNSSFDRGTHPTSTRPTNPVGGGRSVHRVTGMAGIFGRRSQIGRGELRLDVPSQ